MRKKITQLSRLLLAGTALLGATQANAWFATNAPQFTGLAVSSTGLITGSVADADSPLQQVKLTITVDGDTANSKTIFANGSFSHQLPAMYLGGSGNRQISVVALDVNGESEDTTANLSAALTLSNQLSVVSNLALSSTGLVTGTITDADGNAGADTLVKLTIDGNLANRERVLVGQPFSLQVPVTYLNGASHSVQVSIEDASIPGIQISQTLSGTLSMPTNTLPEIEFELRPNGKIYGYAKDPDKPDAKLNILLYVDNGTTPVSVVGLATPTFEMELPAAYHPNHVSQQPMARIVTLKVEDANIPLLFKSEDSPSTNMDVIAFNMRMPRTQVAISDSGLITGFTYDADAPDSSLKVSLGLADIPVFVQTISPRYGADEENFVRTAVPVRRDFRTAAEQDLYGDRVPRAFTFQLPMNGGQNFAASNYNVYIDTFGNDGPYKDTEILAYPVDSRRPLMINDVAMLRAGNLFSLKKTLEHLAGGIDVGATGSADNAKFLFTQLWKREVLGVTGGCSEELVVPTLAANSDPDITVSNTCRGMTHEGKLIENQDDEVMDAEMKKFVPSALVNRFDLVDPRFGSALAPDCGEYRIIYGREQTATRRLFVIFEARLPNPHPDDDIIGCKAIQQVWKDQQNIADPMDRARAMEKFFYEGMTVTFAGDENEYVVPAVIDAENFKEVRLDENYEDVGGGQIRTNQFLNPTTDIVPSQPWVLKEYKIGAMVAESLTANPFKQQQVGDNPLGALFDSTNTTHDLAPVAVSFRADFVGQVVDNIFQPSNNLRCLMHPDLHAMRFNLDNRLDYNSGESISSTALSNELDYFEKASTGNFLAVNANDGVTSLPEAMAVIQAEDAGDLQSCAENSSQFKCQITPQQVLNRATARTCGGCHQPASQNITSSQFNLLASNAVGPGQSWPAPLTSQIGLSNFVHVSPDLEEGGKNYLTSTAIRNNFLPDRVAGLRYYLTSNGTAVRPLPAECVPPLSAPSSFSSM